MAKAMERFSIQRKESMDQVAERGKAFTFSDERARLGTIRHLDAPIIEQSVLQAGAFDEATGPRESRAMLSMRWRVGVALAM